MQLVQRGDINRNKVQKRWVGITASCPSCGSIALMEEQDEPMESKIKQSITGNAEFWWPCPTDGCHSSLHAKQNNMLLRGKQPAWGIDG